MRKLPKPRISNLVTGAKSADNAAENGLDDHFGIFTRHLDNARDFFDQFCLSHAVLKPA